MAVPMSQDLSNIVGTMTPWCSLSLSVHAGLTLDRHWLCRDRHDVEAAATATAATIARAMYPICVSEIFTIY